MFEFNYKELQSHIGNKGLKQKFIAEQIGISEKTLSHILTGKRSCTLNEYFSICSLLKVKPDKFIIPEKQPINA